MSVSLTCRVLSDALQIMGLDERIRTVLQSEAEENKGDEGDQEEQRAAAATSMARLRPDALARWDSTETRRAEGHGIFSVCRRLP